MDNNIWISAKEAELQKEWYDTLPKISFDEALEKLGISDFRERIINSNSHGELFHIQDYIVLAAADLSKEKFSEWFRKVVKFAEDNWTRPESIFQHIFNIFMTNVTVKGEGEQ